MKSNESILGAIAPKRMHYLLLMMIVFTSITVTRDSRAAYPQTLTTNSPWVNLPRPTDDPRWAKAFSHWNKRADKKEAKAAIAIVEKIAQDKPKSFECQLWLCRMNFLMAMRELRKRNMYCDRSIKAGDRALKIKPGDFNTRLWRYASIVLRRDLTNAEFAEMLAMSRQNRGLRHIPTPPGDPLWAKALKKYDARMDLKQARAAIEEFKKIDAIKPKRIEAKVYLAMTYYWLGSNEPDVKAASKLHYKGVEWSKKAVKLEPRNPSANYIYGVTLGSYATAEGMSAYVRHGMDIAKAIILSIEEDPVYLYGGFSRFTATSMAFAGKFSLRVTALLGFPKDLIMRITAFSTRLEPACLDNHLSLAIMYLSFKMKKEARASLVKVIKSDPTVLKLYEPENRLAQKQAKELIDEHYKGK